MSLPDIPDWLAPHLAPEERVLWTGQPAQGIVLSAGTLLLNLIGAVILLITLTWTTLVMLAVGEPEGSGGDILYKALYVGALALGLYLIVGVHFHDARFRARTHYALTDRAAYRLLPGGPDAGVRRSPLNSQTNLAMTGTGARRQILFDDRIEKLESGAPHRRRIGFQELTEALPVYELMLKIKEGRA